MKPAASAAVVKVRGGSGGGPPPLPARIWAPPAQCWAIAAQLHQKSQKVRLHGESDAHNHKDAEYLQAAVNIM